MVLTATLAAATRRSKEEPTSGEHGMFYPDRPAEKTCEEICTEDKGMDKATCDTECAVKTDLGTHHMDDAVEDVAADESYNEQGGNSIEDKVEADHPVEVLDCAPEVDIEKTPELSDIDTKQDGVLDEEECKAWGKKACVPDEMTEQIFNQADANCDHVIDEEEFTEAGEDTAQEEALDEALEDHYEGDDELNNVQAIPLEKLDENKDGALDPTEHKNGVKFEMERREEGRWSVPDEEVPEEASEEAFDTVDADGDGLITGDEYEAPAEDGGSSLGEEIKEAAGADEDASDPDDVKQQPPAEELLSKRFKVQRRNKPVPATSASMLSKRFKVAQRNEAAFLRRFNIPERKLVSKKRARRTIGHVGRALVELARKHQALRQKKLRSHHHHHHTSFRRHAHSM